jgi:hypothetical protein
MEAAAPRCKMQAASCCKLLQAKVSCSRGDSGRDAVTRKQDSATPHHNAGPSVCNHLVSPHHSYVMYMYQRRAALLYLQTVHRVCHMKQNLYRHRLHPFHSIPSRSSIHPSIHSATTQNPALHPVKPSNKQATTPNSTTATELRRINNRIRNDIKIAKANAEEPARARTQAICIHASIRERETQQPQTQAKTEGRPVGPCRDERGERPKD